MRQPMSIDSSNEKLMNGDDFVKSIYIPTILINKSLNRKLGSLIIDLRLSKYDPKPV